MAGLLPGSLFAVSLLTAMGDIPFVVAFVVFWAVGAVMVRHLAGNATMGPNSISLWLHPTVPVRCRHGRTVGQPTTRSA